jgi:hypothetical protein
MTGVHRGASGSQPLGRLVVVTQRSALRAASSQSEHGVTLFPIDSAGIAGLDARVWLRPDRQLSGLKAVRDCDDHRSTLGVRRK